MTSGIRSLIQAQAGQREDGDVVFLTEVLRTQGYFLSRLNGNGRGALESKQFSVGVARFYDSVRKHSDCISRIEIGFGFAIVGQRGQAQRQGCFTGQLRAFSLGRQMPGVGQGQAAVGKQIGAQAGGEAAQLAIAQHQVQVSQ